MDYFDLFALPKELVETIFREFSLVDESVRKVQLLISKTWSATLWRVQSDLSLYYKIYDIRYYPLICPANVKTIRTVDSKKLEDETIQSCFNVEKLTVDDMENNTLTTIYSKFTALRSLTSSRPKLSNEDLIDLGQNLTKLTYLNLIFLQKTDSWPNLSNLVKLRFLSLPHSKFKQEVFEGISYLTNLTLLNLNFCRLGKSAMNAICSLTQLRNINLSKLPEQAEHADTWINLTNLTNLISLRCHIPKDAAHLIGKLENLTSLHASPEEYKAELNMNLLSRLTAIVEAELGFSFTKFPTTWTNLTALAASHAQIDGDMKFDTLTRLKALQMPLAPSAFPNLTLLTNLESFACMDQTSYRYHSDLQHLSACTNLKWLHLIADSSSADVISTLTSLQSLDVSCLTNDTWPESELYKLTTLRGLQNIRLNMKANMESIQRLLLRQDQNEK